MIPNSGQLVLPKMFSPAIWKRTMSSLLRCGIQSSRERLEYVQRCPAR